MLCVKETPEERLAIEGLDPARSDIITAGALILRQSFRELGLKTMRVSEYALREGILYDTLEKRQNGHESDHLKNIRFNSILNLSETFNNEIRHGRQVAKLALAIFDQTSAAHELGGREREFLEAAALLHEIGLFVSHDQHHRHSYYIVRNAELMGFTEDEKEIIANIARYHRKSHPKLKHEGYATLSEDDQETVKTLAGILRIADGLDRSHRSKISAVKVTRRGDLLRLDLTAKRTMNVDLEMWGAELKKGLFEEVFDVRVRSRLLGPRKK
jgi:exopolyphosphatase/guanosine-5'-triphosphate,3'-diphosphate pyrophosphatase